MIGIGRKHGCPLRVVESAIEANERQKRMMLEKIEAGLGGLEGRTLAVLGLSYKPDTDDVQQAPAIAIIEGLAEKGARIRAYDPAAAGPASRRLAGVAGKLAFCADEYDAAEGADALIIVTEWDRFRILDLEKAKGLLAHPVLFDLRDIYDRGSVEEKGFAYYGVGC